MAADTPADTATDLPDDIKAMNFETALAELEAIVQRLEGGDASLDDAIASYQRGAQLKRHCQDKLKDAQEKVEKIRLTAEGVTAEPADLG